jgi:prepilin-type processing-associated H-X9-DG protein
MNEIKINKVTLIEILVVVAIIAVLASLLLPALGKARETARIAVCVSNHKQIGLAMYNYSSDSDDYLIYSKWVFKEDGSNAGGLGISWDDLLNPYLGGTLNTRESKYGYLNQKDNELAIDAFICPSDRWGTRSAGTAAQSYSANQRVLGSTNFNWASNENISNGLFEVRRYEASGDIEHAVQGQAKFADINGTSECFAITDAPNNRNNNCHQGSTHGRKELRHLWRDNGALQAQLNIPWYGVDDQTGSATYDDKTNLGALELHLGKLNYLFVDGHVETLNPYSTIGSGNQTNPRGIWSYDPND